MNMVNKVIKYLYQFFVVRNVLSLTCYFTLPRQRYISGTAQTKFGKINYVDSPTFISGVKEIFVDEIYQVKRWSSNTPIVLDCGANIGISALYFAKKHHAKVYAIEADPHIFKVLTKNIDHNCEPGSIQSINKAVWINEDGVDFDLEGGYSGQIHQHGHELVKNSIRIPSIRLRILIKQLGNIDFLKLDIEGAENKVLLDCKGVLKRINYIFIEYHSNKNDPQMLGEILCLLKEEGFRYHIKEAFVSENPFLETKEMCGMDLQLNIYATNYSFIKND